MRINILMLGARRTGKSSTLSVMVEEFEKITEAGDIKITPDSSTKTLLDRKKDSLKKIFDGRYKAGERWTGDEDPTDNLYNYVFNIRTQGSKEPIILDFKDIPGEMLSKEEEHNAVMNHLNESDVIIIAIDTPHLMEENGAYNRFNLPVYIENCFAEMNSERDKPRLVLFVPLKCEKYYYENRLEEVSEQILQNKSYGMLLKGIENNEKRSKFYTVAITPILTLGGVVFDDFKRDEDGYVERVRTSGSLSNRPVAAYYKLYEKNPIYTPKYCEQPVLYVLNFAFAVSGMSVAVEKQQNHNEKRKGAIFKRVIIGGFAGVAGIILYELVRIAIKKYKGISDNKVLVEGVIKSRKSMKVSGDGYRLVFDPLRIKGE